jgi:uncharacterized protein
MKRLAKYKSDIVKLCEEHKVKSLYAFGSVLTDHFNDESDVDHCRFYEHSSGGVRG